MEIAKAIGEEYLQVKLLGGGLQRVVCILDLWREKGLVMAHKLRRYPAS